MGTPLRLVQQMTDAVMVGVEPRKVGIAYRELCKQFPLVEIQSKQHYQSALRLIEHSMNYLARNESASIADDLNQYLAVLADLVVKYEKEHFPTERVSGAEILKQLMEMHNLKQEDLREELGGQSVVSMILRGERELNVRQIRALAKRFRISPEAFL